MAGFCVGTMSIGGWETQSVPEALSRHLTYWFASRRNQGKVIPNTPSFYYLWQQYGMDQHRMINEARQQLKDYMDELFPNSVCDVSTTDKTEHGSVYTLNFSIQVIYDSVPYDLAASVLVTNELYKLLDDERLSPNV